MDHMLVVVVFDSANKAFAGMDELLELERDGRLQVPAYAVLAKHADGSVTVERQDGVAGVAPVVSMVLGSLIGLMGGPAGVATGAYAGIATGTAVDLDRVRIDTGFVDEVSRNLTPNKFALVAETEEDWNSLVDQHMEKLGGDVSRYSMADVRKAVGRDEVASMKAYLSRLRAELEKSTGERMAKLHGDIQQLEQRIKAALQRA